MRFDELGLDADILRSLEAMNFEEMTPVQEHTIPIILENKDLIGCAQTGTGKTAAYTLPLLDKLLREGNPDNVVKSLIVVPTRELAQQIDVQFQGFSYFLPLSTTVVYGGGDGIGWEQQKQGMLRGSDIVVATPGRLLAHIANSGIDLSHVSYFVLDEADRMLDMGFFDDIMKIIKELPTERQTIMFSATLPPKIRQMAKQILRNPAEVNIAVSKPNEAIQQGIYVCYENQKMEIVRALFGEPTGTKTIIFSSSKQKVKELAYTLKRMKLNAAAMHSDLEQEQREEVMLDFKNGKIDLLVATDIVARGIDIEDIGTVVNYDVPHDRRTTSTASDARRARAQRAARLPSSAKRSRASSTASKLSWSGMWKNCRSPSIWAKAPYTIPTKATAAFRAAEATDGEATGVTDKAVPAAAGDATGATAAAGRIRSRAPGAILRTGPAEPGGNA